MKRGSKMWMMTWQALSVTPYQKVKQQRKEYDDVLWWSR